MPMRVLLGSLAVLLQLAAPAGAQLTAVSGPGDFTGPITVLDFDEQIHGTAANTLYGALGIEFAYDELGSPVPIIDWTDFAPPRVTTSSPNVLSTEDGINGSVFSDVLDLFFSVPITEVGAFFGNDQGVLPVTVQLSLFDPSDALIGFTTVSANLNTSVDQFIGLISTTPFSRARVEYLTTIGDLSVTLDDVHFSTIPEPGTALLLGLGLAGLAVRRRR